MLKMFITPYLNPSPPKGSHSAHKVPLQKSP